MFPNLQNGYQNPKWSPAKLKCHICLAVEITYIQMKYQIIGFFMSVKAIPDNASFSRWHPKFNIVTN